MSGTRDHTWAILRRLVEASTTEVVRHLWPDGDATAPAEVDRLVERMRSGDDTLPTGLLRAASTRSAGVAEQAAVDLQWAADNGWRLITPDSPEWPGPRWDEAFAPVGDLDPDAGGAAVPGSVRGAAARPFALWARGSVELAATVERSVALVGTRTSSAYGNRTTHRIAGDLAAAGYTVISGGAVGIDTAAHRGALDASGPTVAVAASGPGEIYPRTNAALFRRIAETGLVISEYPPLMSPARYRFLTRNRLVAALGRGTVLLAAGYRSGAVNTTNWADAMLRPVMVLPGPVDSAVYVGCHQKIRDGAGTLITSAAEIRELLEPVGAVDPEGQLGLDFAPSPVQQLSRDQLTVFDACGIGSDGTGHLDQIAVDTTLPMAAVVRIVSELEVAGMVRRAGDRWIKNDR